MKCQTRVAVEPSNNNKHIVCEAVNCHAEASKIIEVSTNPNGGTISLSVCENCEKKFSSEALELNPRG